MFTPARYLMLFVLLELVSSCGKEDDPPIAIDSRSAQASLLSLEVAFEGRSYSTSLEGNDFTLTEPLPFYAEEVTIEALSISPDAACDRAVGDALLVDDSPISLTITAENKATTNTYQLYLNTEAKPDDRFLLFEDPTATSCSQFSVIETGEMSLENNTWNASNLPQGSFSQCIYLHEVGNFRLLGWEWDYPENAFGVNAYPQLIYGWKPWQSQSTTTQLPRKVSEVNILKSTYDVEVERNDGDYNLAFDIWINSETDITPENIQFELMIWEETNNLVPFGAFQEEISTTNGNYLFYQGEPTWEPPGSNWTYLAFQRTTDRQSGTVDIDEILDYLVGKGIVPADSYLGSIEFGNEIGNSTGRTIVKQFDIALH